jgi:hypothetical protein
MHSRVGSPDAAPIARLATRGPLYAVPSHLLFWSIRFRISDDSARHRFATRPPVTVATIDSLSGVHVASSRATLVACATGDRPVPTDRGGEPPGTSRADCFPAKAGTCTAGQIQKSEAGHALDDGAGPPVHPACAHLAERHHHHARPQEFEGVSTEEHGFSAVARE